MGRTSLSEGTRFHNLDFSAVCVSVFGVNRANPLGSVIVPILSNDTRDSVQIWIRGAAAESGKVDGGVNAPVVAAALVRKENVCR